LAEEQKQSELRKRWAAKEERTGQFREQELERRKIAKIARELLTQAKRDRADQVRKESIEDRRQKTAQKIEIFYKKAEFQEEIEYATNEELKEYARLQWINKQHNLKPKEESPGPGHYFGGSDIDDSPPLKKNPENEKQVTASFPSLANARSKLKELVSPIIAQASRAWSMGSEENGSLPNVSGISSYK